MQQLRGPKRSESQDKVLLRLGIMSGLSIAFLIYILYVVLTVHYRNFPHFHSVIIVYRMLGMVLLLTWCWGFNMLVWSRWRINYVYILELDPRSSVSHHHVLEAAATFTFMYMLSLSGYFLGEIKPQGLGWIGAIPIWVHPTWLMICSLGVFLFFQIRSRFWLTRTLGRIIISPLRPVFFKDFFLADQLLSIAIVLMDMGFTICYYTRESWDVNYHDGACEAKRPLVDPIIAAFPLYWRIMQCFRRYRDSKDKYNLVNAGKYGTSLLVVLFSALKPKFYWGFYVWIALAIIATVYALVWDLKMDWNLLQFRRNRKAPLLRKHLIFPTYYYYSAMVIDGCLRFGWTMSISTDILLNQHPIGFATLLVSVEILRRAMWNVFRMENEQLHDVEKYRKVHLLVPPAREAY
eukprot:TRINITY_DN6833_c0_g1_i2.p1 TRINITY_DN6833_c0_g1~~TRINITY_DN6833_c0_g1_i2.p1  ORF type:complete len:406 (+),score=62.61 TRINITY_DN6833_c0_g1_i2:162-1379(+)